MGSDIGRRPCANVVHHVLIFPVYLARATVPMVRPLRVLSYPARALRVIGVRRVGHHRLHCEGVAAYRARR